MRGISIPRTMTPRKPSVKPRRNRHYAPLPLSVAAEMLGVSHSHLWMVVNEKRTSASLLKRYLTLAEETSRASLASAKAGKVA